MHLNQDGCHRLSKSKYLGVARGILVVALIVGSGWARAGEPAPPLPAPSPAPAGQSTAPTSMEEVLNELRQLRQEVQETRQLRQQVSDLQNQLNIVGTVVPVAPAPSVLSTPNPSLPAQTATAPGVVCGPPAAYRSGAPAAPACPPPDDNFPFTANYKYSYNATGPLGGGGYTRFATPDDEFSVNITNQITMDGTYFSRANMPTTEKGFNIPFARNFIYGNITKNWLYQVGTQGFLGSFNLLDMWMAYRFGSALTIRAGKGLAPPLYEYYAFSPALEPVITNSPLFQTAAARPLGIMASGNILDNRIQWWSGVTNTAKSTYYAIDRNVEYNGAVDFTPFKTDAWKDSALSGLGGGVGFSAGNQNYLLNQGNSIGFTNNGEASTNSAWITSSGIPFAVYNPNVSANGLRTRFAPHIYYFGRFSVLAEYMEYSRELTDGTTTGRSTQRGYYVNLSYFLTGESDFKGNGFQAYSTVNPLHPLNPSKGQWGPGAWQIATQWSELNIGTGDFQRGFIDPTRYTNRLDQLMTGLNWWPNKYTRLSFDWVWTGFNNPIPLNNSAPVSTFNTFWMRFAMFF